MARLRLAIFLVLALTFAGRPTKASDEVFVKRGEIQREGRVWVEVATCGGPGQNGGRLVLRADFGSVVVKPGAAGRVDCRIRLRVAKPTEEEARRFLRRVELSARTVEGGGLYVEEKFPPGHERFGWTGVDFEFNVPKRFNVDLETKGGNVVIGSLDGEVRAGTAGGDIQTGDISGPTHVETAGGDIDLGTIGQRVVAQTAGGAIRVSDIRGDAILETSGGEITTGLVSGSVRAETSGGDIVLRGASGPVIAETAGGQIQIGECGATVRAETAGGSIHLQGAKGGVVVDTAGGSIDLFRIQSAVRAETTAGRILAELDGNRNTFANSHLETAVGDVEVFLPPDLPLNIDALIEQSFGHQIVSDFPIRIVSEDEEFRHGPKRGEGPLNGGGQVLRIRTAMGNIEIRKINSQVLEQIKVRQQAFWKKWEEEQKAHQVKCCQQPKED